MVKHARALRVLGWIMSGVSAAVMAWQAVQMWVGGVSRVHRAAIIALSVCLPLIAGTTLLTWTVHTPGEKRRTVRRMLWVLFGFYLWSLACALIFSRINFATFQQDCAFYRSNWELMTNFIPLETVKLYIRCLIYDYIGTGIPLSNLFGNILLFMPMAGLLPCLFPSMGKFWKFLLLMSAMLTAVEALQLLLCCGSCDIDDVILNLCGTLLLYGLLKIPPIQRAMGRLYLLPMGDEQGDAAQPGAGNSGAESGNAAAGKGEAKEVFKADPPAGEEAAPHPTETDEN